MKKPKVVSVGGQPVLQGQFCNENVFVASGYDRTPLAFKDKGNGFESVGTLDAGKNKVKKALVKRNAFGGQQVFFENEEVA